jgi:hypothetical protein
VGGAVDPVDGPVGAGHLARGGSFRATLWQVRAFMWIPALTYLFATSLRGPRDHAALGKLILVAALIKAALGVYFLEVVCRQQGYWPSYATTHSDTLIFVSAVVIAGTTVLERPTLRTALFALAIVVPVFAGIIVNSRRLAYVGIVGSGVAIYLVLPYGPLLRSATRTLVALGPVAALYLAVGWTSDLALFGPARKVASLFSKEDRSAAMRDIENYNLILTWKQHPFLGLGFGHEYSELTSPEGAAQNFPLYRFIAHNSVLWLEATGGVVAFTAFWIVPATLAYFAARAHGGAQDPVDRAAALVALSVSVTFVIQAYGDMGLTSWPAMFLLATALAVASKLAVATGVFPRGE